MKICLFALVAGLVVACAERVRTSAPEAASTSQQKWTLVYRDSPRFGVLQPCEGGKLERERRIDSAYFFRYVGDEKNAVLNPQTRGYHFFAKSNDRWLRVWRGARPGGVFFEDFSYDPVRQRAYFIMTQGSVGVSEAFGVNLQTLEFERLTDGPRSVSAPAVLPDGSLLYTEAVAADYFKERGESLRRIASQEFLTFRIKIEKDGRTYTLADLSGGEFRFLEGDVPDDDSHAREKNVEYPRSVLITLGGRIIFKDGRAHLVGAASSEKGLLASRSSGGHFSILEISGLDDYSFSMSSREYWQQNLRPPLISDEVHSQLQGAEDYCLNSGGFFFVLQD